MFLLQLFDFIFQIIVLTCFRDLIFLFANNFIRLFKYNFHLFLMAIC